jgi:hypothetical protein
MAARDLSAVGRLSGIRGTTGPTTTGRGSVAQGLAFPHGVQ